MLYPSISFFYLLNPNPNNIKARLLDYQGWAIGWTEENKKKRK